MEFGDFGDYRGILCDCLVILVFFLVFSDYVIVGGYISRLIEFV